MSIFVAVDVFRQQLKLFMDGSCKSQCKIRFVLDVLHALLELELVLNWNVIEKKSHLVVELSWLFIYYYYLFFFFQSDVILLKFMSTYTQLKDLSEAKAS